MRKRSARAFGFRARFDNLSAPHFLINAYDVLCAISNAQGDREKADEYDKKAEEYRERGNDTL